VATPPLLERLIDHAALFPPASMSLDDALAEDRRARESPHADVIGRFVVPAALLPDLPGERPQLSVVLRDPGEIDSVRAAAGVEAVELRLEDPRPRPADILETYRALQPLGVEAYFELVLDDNWRDSVPAAIGSISAVGGRVKLRCGGETVPTVEQVAFVIAVCRDSGVPFKATAGLHHAVRHDGEHGFLNLLAAATAPRPRLEAVLAEEDPAALHPEEAARAVFTSFGSCSWEEPVEDLVGLGLLS
jgi:hypothetical protein